MAISPSTSADDTQQSVGCQKAAIRWGGRSRKHLPCGVAPQTQTSGDASILNALIDWSRAPTNALQESQNSPSQIGVWRVSQSGSEQKLQLASADLVCLGLSNWNLHFAAASLSFDLASESCAAMYSKHTDQELHDSACSLVLIGMLQVCSCRSGMTRQILSGCILILALPACLSCEIHACQGARLPCKPVALITYP